MGYLSQIDVVNDMLAILGETAVNSLTDGHPLIVTAVGRLRIANAREQGRGWWFNTERVTLQPTTDNEVILTPDILKVDPLDTSLNYSQRGNRLYNLNADTTAVSGYKIVAPVECTLVRLLPFDDLPGPVQFLVSASGQLEFATQMDAGTEKIRDLTAAYKDAMLEVRQEHIRCSDVNFLKTPSVQATLGRVLPRTHR